MHPTPDAHRSWSIRRLIPLGLLLFLAAFGSWFADLSAQDAGKKKPQKPEVEDPNPPTNLKPVRVEEKPDPRIAPKTSILPAADLAAAARQTKNLALQDFYKSLAVPHDIMTMRQSGEARTIEPVAVYVGTRPQFRNAIKVRRLNRDWLPGGTLDITATDIAGIEAYEQIAVVRAERFLNEGYDRLPANDLRYLSRSDMLQAAAQALTAVVGFHESARNRGTRTGEGWDSVDAALRQKLLAIELDYLDVLVVLNDWDTAVAAARRLVGIYRAQQDREQIARPLIQLIDRSLKSGNDEQVREAQRRLKGLDEVFPDLKSAQRLNDNLRRQAEQFFERAKKMVADERFKDAQELLRQAEDIYPRLPDLHDYRLRLEKRYPILRVGVRDLPVMMSPALACTDSERQAVELIFEGLVKLAYDTETGQRYEPGLAEKRPRTIAMGREFQVAREAFWSADRRITAADVRNTVSLLKEPGWPGYRHAWAELIGDVTLGGDPHQVSLHLRQGYLDPLSLMTFKILPPEGLRKNQADFARKPIGSGPYKYNGQGSGDGKNYAVFLANPNYGSRAGKIGLPHIREIHFVRSDNPARDFDKGMLDLLLDLPAKKVKDLERVANVTVSPPMANRRVYFLAINHRRHAFQNQELRRALGLAVPREKLLDDCFRAQPGQEACRALTGPYPAGSWASDPATTSLDRLDQAKALLKAAEKKNPLPRKLTLKFPNDDPQVTQAMTQLCSHFTSELGLEVEPEPLAPHALRDAVEVHHLYDLAYYHYDFPSDAYWLWPLFDSSPRAVDSGGSNYLGYTNDAELERWFREAMSHREYEKVQKFMHVIHKLVESKMLLIPLWQLDTFLAHRNTLKPVGLDPLLVFPAVEHWRVERR